MKNEKGNGKSELERVGLSWEALLSEQLPVVRYHTHHLKIVTKKKRKTKRKEQKNQAQFGSEASRHTKDKKS